MADEMVDEMMNGMVLRQVPPCRPNHLSSLARLVGGQVILLSSRFRAGQLEELMPQQQVSIRPTFCALRDE